MKASRDIIGYIIGLILFIILIPLLMWKASGSDLCAVLRHYDDTGQQGRKAPRRGLWRGISGI